MKKNSFLALFFLILVLIFLYFFYTRNTTNNQTSQKEKIIFKTLAIKDTIIKHEKIYIKAKAKIFYQHDTIREFTTDTITAPFIASLDTIATDTISIRYYYPLNEFLVDIRRRPDTVNVVKIEILKEEKNYFQKYFEKPLYFISGILTSYIIYRTVK